MKVTQAMKRSLIGPNEVTLKNLVENNGKHRKITYFLIGNGGLHLGVKLMEINRNLFSRKGFNFSNLPFRCDISLDQGRTDDETDCVTHTHTHMRCRGKKAVWGSTFALSSKATNSFADTVAVFEMTRMSQKGLITTS